MSPERQSAETRPAPAAPTGSRRYLLAATVIGLAALAKFASAPGQSFLLAVFVEDLIRDTGTSRTGFSLMYGAATVFSAITVLVIGRMIDSRGIAPVWAAVTVGLALGCLILSVAEAAIAVFVALCLMRGFGQGSFPLLGTVLVAARFGAARGRAVGLSAQGVTIATATLPVICVALIAAHGWRPTLQLLAVGLVAVMIPMSFAVRGLERARPVAAASSPGLHLRESFATPGVPLLLAILSLAPLVITAVVVYAFSIGQGNGLDSSQIAVAIGAMAVATVFGSLAGGVLVDRLPIFVAMMTTCLGMAAACLLLIPASAAATYMSFLFLGIFGGVQLATAGTAWARTYGVSRLARLQSLGAFGQIFGAAAGPLPLALSLGLTGSYTPGLVVLALLSILGMAAALAWPRFIVARNRPSRDPAGPREAAAER